MLQHVKALYNIVSFPLCGNRLRRKHICGVIIRCLLTFGHTVYPEEIKLGFKESSVSFYCFTVWETSGNHETFKTHKYILNKLCLLILLF